MSLRCHPNCSLELVELIQGSPSLAVGLSRVTNFFGAEVAGAMRLPIGSLIRVSRFDCARRLLLLSKVLKFVLGLGKIDTLKIETSGIYDSNIFFFYLNY